MSAHFGQIDPLPLTEYVRSCITALSCSDDSPYDHTLAHMAHVQSLVNDVETLRKEESSSGIYKKLFQHQIDELKRNQPLHEETHGTCSVDDGGAKNTKHTSRCAIVIHILCTTQHPDLELGG